jgi:HKD family nuclease
MKFYLQDPNDSGTTYLIEALLSASTGAIAGGGGFAFASPQGVALLFENDQFGGFLDNGGFELVVGTDAVTSPKALEKLGAVQESHPNLQVHAFLNPKAGSLFHPKFCWFEHNDGGVVIAGSGNLTRGGLRGNWEAFTVNEVADDAIAATEAYWDAWIKANGGALRAIDDPAVVERASRNAATAQVMKKALAEAGVEIKEAGVEELEDAGPQPDLASEVLIAEIPKGSTRWNQANFDLATFTNYFGAMPGSAHSVFLFNIDKSGTLPEAPEHRPAVAVKSRNFRFELEAAAHLDYPANGRPIAVFVRVAARTFWYELLMPGQATHTAVAAYLEKNHPIAAGRVRRVTIPFALLQKIVPKLPLVTRVLKA